MDGEDLLSSSGGKKSPYKGTGPKTKHGKGKKDTNGTRIPAPINTRQKIGFSFFARFASFFVGGNEGMPIGLRSEIDDAYAQEWYRQMYRSLNRRRPSNINGYCGSNLLVEFAVVFVAELTNT